MSGERPRFHPPMLAAREQPRGAEDAWVHERKLDGERVLAVRDGDRLRLWTRNAKDATDNYPEITAPLADQAEQRFVLDGEVVAFDAAGQTSFERLQRRMHRSDPMARRATGVTVHYLVFDCLHLGSDDLRRQPLLARKKRLREGIGFGPQILFVPHRAGTGSDAMSVVCEAGWEGLIAKRVDAPYVNGRSSSWCKLKCERSDTFVVVGHTPPKGSRVGIGALLLAEPQDDTLHYVGKVGTGLSDALLDTMRARLGDMERETPPVVDPPDQGDVHWVEPRLHAEVSYTERTSAGRLRHPVFKGLRRDQGA